MEKTCALFLTRTIKGTVNKGEKSLTGRVHSTLCSVNLQHQVKRTVLMARYFNYAIMLKFYKPTDVPMFIYNLREPKVQFKRD